MSTNNSFKKIFVQYGSCCSNHLGMEVPVSLSLTPVFCRFQLGGLMMILSHQQFLTATYPPPPPHL